MINKKILLVLTFFLFTFISHAQEQESVLNSPDTWQNEIIPFPLGFAQEIDFVGFEDLRFAPGWKDDTSQEFWTYTFVWYIEKTDAMTEEILTENFNLYYDGLMGVNASHEGKDSTVTKLDRTICLFVRSETGFSGKMRVYDRFFTKDYMILNIKVTEHFCSKINKQVISCDISPQPFDHEVWGIFKQVSFVGACD